MDNESDEMANVEGDVPAEAKPDEPEFIGADKKIEFGGVTSGQVNIPSGLREADKSQSPG
jgi:hypothetical protein